MALSGSSSPSKRSIFMSLSLVPPVSNLLTVHHLINGYNPGAPYVHPLDPAYTGRVTIPHPSVLEGPRSVYESKRLSNGGLFLRIDMPGVRIDPFTVEVECDGSVTVFGRAPPAMYDTSGREYRGKVAVVPPNYDHRRIKVITKRGVIRFIIPPF